MKDTIRKTDCELRSGSPYRFILAAILMIGIISSGNVAFAWRDVTHIAIAKAAGYHYWFNAAAADLTKEKAGSKEGRNHFFNNDEKANVTRQMVLAQADYYNEPTLESGQLYGAIIGSLRSYVAAKSDNRNGEYRMAFAVHYIGDLSNPLHNIPYDDF
ncbi:MAG: hypothetical protein PHN75_17945, partial [Syntrophales bacterium]|nr:hypothetical protein [Syntrophales bacterium]